MLERILAEMRWFLRKWCIVARQVIEQAANQILKAWKNVPLRVGIDGIDAAGKTTLADEIAAYLSEAGCPVMRASIDGFHNPRQVRRQRGSYSPEGYYYDSFNYELLKKCLLEPLTPTGNRICRLKAFDFITDAEVFAEDYIASDAHILIFDGVFLFRREIRDDWDLKIWVDIDFQTSLQRALKRDLNLFGDEQEIQKRYLERYIPGQELYIRLEKPQMQADIIIDNNDYTAPRVVFHGGTV